MPEEILFPDVEPRYDFDRDCLAFPAKVAGKLTDCLVTLELLMQNFGAQEPTEEAMRRAYTEHKEEIRDMARTHIRLGWIDEDYHVILTTHHTRLDVHYDTPLVDDPRVVSAHRFLIGLIGPNAGHVRIEWRQSPESPPNPAIHLAVKDPAIRRQVSTSFPPKAWDDPNLLQVMLAQIWSALLSARSRHILQKSG